MLSPWLWRLILATVGIFSQSGQLGVYFRRVLGSRERGSAWTFCRRFPFWQYIDVMRHKLD